MKIFSLFFSFIFIFNNKIDSVNNLKHSSTKMQSFKVIDFKTDTNKVCYYQISSPYSSGKNVVRIKFTEQSSDSIQLILILPVESKNEQRFGDGFKEALKLPDTLTTGYTIASATFSDVPWFADHPSLISQKQESYLLYSIIPFFKYLFVTKKLKISLIGFSKSGWGAMSLILRNPEVFDVIVAWDAPLMLTAPYKYQMETLFKTQKNFDNYYLPKKIEEKASLFQSKKRIALTGYEFFREDMAQMHDLLNEFKIPHLYADGPKIKHIWGSGWLQEAFVLVKKMKKE